MEMWLVVIFSFLSYSCNGSLVDQSTQRSVIAECEGINITYIKMEVDVMKGNYHALLLRVINNEHEIAFLKGQTQQLEHELENTRRTFSCELQGLRDTTIQYEHQLNETIHSLAALNETVQDLSHSVSVLDNKYPLLVIPGRHSNESTAVVKPPIFEGGTTYLMLNVSKMESSSTVVTWIFGSFINDKRDELECPLNWIRRVDFGACYFYSDKRKSWNDAQEQCRKHNGSLTDIYSENEAVWLAEYSRNHTAMHFWIGGKRYHDVYKWVTSDGKTKQMNYTRWAIGYPFFDKTDNISSCVDLWEDDHYKMGTYNCHNDVYFICKTLLLIN